MLTTSTTRSEPTTPDPLPAPGQPPALLVSVRDPSEALSALRGGAGVIDVKEPSRGPLGAADRTTVEAIVHAVAGRAPVTVAWGELSEHAALPAAVPGVAAYKVGLAGAIEAWADRLAAWRDALPPATKLVPAAYWDDAKAGAPTPGSVLESAARIDGWMVLDTWDKTAGTLPLDDARLARLMAQAHRAGVRVALAGGMAVENLRRAALLKPALVGVRGAACEGGRAGRVDFQRVRALNAEIVRTKRSGLP
ncbi:hypothetical protein MalM25_09100 [Planctomycetes bacterium MalM25]|nr:hypothetical protein MalM25_09100 [Planctomycetes bacterium MalM25]